MWALLLLLSAAAGLAGGQGADYGRLLFGGYELGTGILHTSADGTEPWNRSPSGYAFAPSIAAWVDPYGAGGSTTFVLVNGAALQLWDSNATEATAPLRSAQLSFSSELPSALLALPDRDLLLVAFLNASRIDSYSLNSFAYFGLWTSAQRNPAFSQPSALLRLQPEGSVLVAFAGSDSVWEFDASGSASPWTSLPSPLGLVAEQDGLGGVSGVIVISPGDGGAGAEAFRFVRAGGGWIQAGSVLIDGLSPPFSAGLAFGDPTTLLAPAANATGFSNLAAVSLLDGQPVVDSGDAVDAVGSLLGPTAILPDREATDEIDQIAVDGFSFASLDETGVRAASRVVVSPCAPGGTGAVSGRIGALYRCGASVISVEDLSVYELKVEEGALCFVRYLFAAEAGEPIVGSAWDASTLSLYLAQDVGLPGGHSLVTVRLSGAEPSCSDPEASLDPTALSLVRATRQAAVSPRLSAVRMHVGSAPWASALLPCYSYGNASSWGDEALTVACLDPSTGQPAWSQAFRAPQVADAWAFWSARDRVLRLATRAGSVLLYAQPEDGGQRAPLAQIGQESMPPSLGSCRLRASYEPLADSSAWQWCSEPGTLYWWTAVSPFPCNGTCNATAGWAPLSSGAWIASLTTYTFAAYGYGEEPVYTVPPECDRWACQSAASKAFAIVLTIMVMLGMAACCCSIVGVRERRRLRDEAAAARKADSLRLRDPTLLREEEEEEDAEGDDPDIDDEEAERRGAERLRAALCYFLSCFGLCERGKKPNGHPRRRGRLGRLLCWICDRSKPAPASGFRAYLELSDLAPAPASSSGFAISEPDAPERVAAAAEVSRSIAETPIVLTEVPIDDALTPQEIEQMSASDAEEKKKTRRSPPAGDAR